MKSLKWLVILSSLAWLHSAPALAQSLILVPSQGTLQQAINGIADGGVIEIANGTYNAPAGGFRIENQTKRFTIRAATGASVTLSGANTTEILRFTNLARANGRPVVFERLRFANGRSTIDNIAGAVSLVESDATFVGCSFDSNNAVSTGGGGGAVLAQSARVFFIDTTFSANTARLQGGALGLGNGAIAFIHNSSFLNNRTNLPGHSANSVGGAMFVLNSALRVTNSRFDGNQTGFSGGAIYSYGSWTGLPNPSTDIVITNSTFANNLARRDPGTSSDTTTQGGAVQGEDYARIVMHYTRFFNNSSTQGGALAAYRAALEVYNSTFQGNTATGTTHLGEASGGAIFLVSQDQQPADPVNRPSTTLTLRDSLVQGRTGTQTTNGRFGGCLYAAGDGSRAFGANGIPQMGTVDSNRSVVEISGSVFADCTVRENSGGSIGGAIISFMTRLNITDSLFIGNEALPVAANTGTGGALASFNYSITNLLRTTIAKSRAGFVGGAILVQGSELNIDDSQIVENSLTGSTIWGGTAIYSAPESANGVIPAVNVSGVVRNSIISNNTGATTFLDYDPGSAPVNVLQYSNNQIFPGGAGVYATSQAPAATSVAQLNGLVLHGIPKAPVANTVPAAAPVVAALLAAPTATLPTSAVGDAAPPTLAYVAGAWSGSSATLHGSPLTGNSLLLPATPGIHPLVAGAVQRNATLNAGASPALSATARPRKLGPGANYTLSWATFAGNFLGIGFDQKIDVPVVAAGNLSVGPVSASHTVRGIVVTQEGGATSTNTIQVIADLLFYDDFE
ncbi:MAG: hypothetical protein JNN30_12880 [Rhodanobacteraceae bacterium]|nr:hypothetical protein [Rhodanobacteraceae bacterium]